jgi:hypothetical protein
LKECRKWWLIRGSFAATAAGARRSRRLKIRNLVLAALVQVKTRIFLGNSAKSVSEVDLIASSAKIVAEMV